MAELMGRQCYQNSPIYIGISYNMCTFKRSFTFCCHLLEIIVFQIGYHNEYVNLPEFKYM